MILGLWNYIKGYVIIVVEGYFTEKFINICIHRQIFLWDIEKNKKNQLILKVSARGFKQLRPIAKKSKCRVKILKKVGAAFWINRHKKRKAFLVGAISCLIIFYSLISFVWTIEINGNKKVEETYVLNTLNELGVRTGMLKYKLNADYVVNHLMLNIDELAWASVELRGTKVKVEIVERVEKPKVIPKNIPCHIIASKDGVVRDIIVKAGQEKVLEGDTVQQGDILISGVVETINEEIQSRLVHAIGNVEARTWYEENIKVNKKIKVVEKTGNVKNKYEINLFNKNINFFNTTISFENYDKIEEKKKITLFGEIDIPFEIVKKQYNETRIVEVEISKEEAERRAVEEAIKNIDKLLPDTAKKIDTKINFVKQENGEVIANVIVECLEEIGVQQEILGY